MEQSTTSPKTSKVVAGYQNNPFYVATDGLDRLFKKAQSVGIFFAIISAVSLFSYRFPGDSSANTGKSSSNDDFSNWLGSIPTDVWIGVGVFALILVLVFTTVGIVFKGVSDFTAAKLARGESTTLGEAFRGVFSRFWGYAWVLVIRAVKTFLWTLLFIIPGIVMGIRYSLAGVSFFDSDRKGDAAIKDSLALTKGALLTTFASQTLFNIVTLGFISPLLESGTNSVLYGQLRGLTDKGVEKPKAHLLSKITFGLIVFLVFLIAVLLVALVYAALNYAHTAP